MKPSFCLWAPKAVASCAVLISLFALTPALRADEIHDAAAKGDVAAMGRLLAGNAAALDSKGRVYMQDVDTWATGTALHVAVMHRQGEAVKFLLSNGAGINAKSESGNTPLHMAAWRGYKDILDLLLTVKGVDVNVVNNAGKTPLLLAVEGFPRGEPTSSADRAACVELLLNKGAKPDIKDSNGDTPLQLAQSEGDRDMLAAFQKNGVKVNLPRVAAPANAPQGAFVVPFKTDPVILVQGKINNKTVTFGFDTGASHTVLSPEAAREAGVRISGQFSAADVGAGDAVLKGQRVAVMAMPQFQQFQMLGVKVAGILGYPYLSQFVITFDYRNKQLTLLPRATAPPLKEEAGSHVVTFFLHPRANLIFLQAKVNGSEPLTFLFDSGAQETFLTPATANRLGIRGTGQQQTNIGAVSSATVNSISVGGAEAKNIAVMIANPPQAMMLNSIGQKYDGILGRNFFSKFKITVDYRTKQLKLTPNQ